MSLKLTIAGDGTSDGANNRVDIVIDAPSGITVGALAALLAERSPHHLHDARGHAATLALRRDSGVSVPLDPSLLVSESAVVSGATVEFVSAASGLVPDPGAPADGYLIVVSGPDAGARFGLRQGSNVIGRDTSCDVVLADELTSRRHARIEVGGAGGPAEVVDLGSVNGTIVGGKRVERATVGPTTDILVGDTTLRVESVPGGVGAAGNEFVRSPPTVSAFVADELTAPRAPSEAKRGRIPVIAAIAPLLLGGVMYAMTRRAESLIFIALSPVMLVGNALESKLSSRRGKRESTTQFRRELAEFDAEARRRIEVETEARRAEHPELPELAQALRDRTPTLWSRRPDGDHFAEIAVGRARRPARSTFAAPQHTDGVDELVAQRDELIASLRDVHGVPVAVDLAADGSIGVAGPPARARNVSAAMVASAALLHSPAELTIALLTSESAAADWDWLKWLPHVDDAHSPFEGSQLASTTAGCVAVQGAIAALVEARRRASGSHQRSTHLPVVLVVIDDDAPIERSLLVELVERGPEAGVHTIWVANSIERLPAGCGAVVDARHGPDQMSLRIRRSKELIEDIRLTAAPPVALTRLARDLSPIVDVGARVRGETGLPSLVLGPRLLGLPPSPPPEALVARWSQTSVQAARERDTGLRAAVGIAGGEPFVLDLRTHGPHALVGGTTGAGKSEFLQAWVMGLATAYGPERVNFLFVDYKGGAAFSECVKLPHCVGLVTDLSPHLVDRALTSLRAELHRREQLFGALDAKDIHELERRGAPETPPALVIVVDEFAALVQEVPDFVDGVVNVAQRGRSLGLHLVLATQRPAGVITGNLRANTNLRIALRMADESDSSDVIDANDAAYIDAANPGRGVAKIGPGRTFAFQSAFYGGWSGRAADDGKVVVRTLAVDGGEVWAERRGTKPATDEPNDLAQMVAACQRAALFGQSPTPRRPWLPELPTQLDLREAPLTRSDGEIVFGTADLPAQQAQPPIAFFPDRDGNMAVFGSGGSGKSTLLRTLAMSAGASAERPGSTDGPCHVYCIDFGSRSLHLLEDFAHVGAVITADDHERIARLLRELRATVDERQGRYRAADADTIAQYRERSGNSAEPRIVLMIDNYGAFRQAYDVPDRAAALATLVSIMADGRSAGVHVVLTADRPGAVPSSVASLVARRLVLRLANDSDYLLVGEPVNVLDSTSPAGRGIEDGREFQVAVLGGTSDLAEQTRLARALARHDDFTGGRAAAPPVRHLPTVVRLDDLPAAAADRPTLGIDDATLAPVGFVPAGGFVVAGPPGSGRTTALATLAAALDRWRPGFQRVLFAQRRSPLLTALAWTTVADRPSEHASLAAAITADLKQLDGEVAGLAIFVENTTEALDAPEAEAALVELIKTALAHDAFVVIEGEATLLARAWKLDAVKNQRTGLLLQPQLGDGDLLKAQLPRVSGSQWPAGRGFLVARRDVVKVQVATP